MGSQSELNRNIKRCTSVHNTIRISCIAKPLPTQFIGPVENGIKAASSWTKSSDTNLGAYFEGGLAFSIASCPEAISHLSGQNVSGKEKLRASRWSEYAGK